MMTAMEGIRTIAARMKDYRIDYPLTQKQLAERSGVSLRSIQRFEKGEDIQFGNLIKLLNALGLDDNIKMLVPDVSSRPSAFVEASVKRKRVRIAKSGTERKTGLFKWGDEE